MKELRKTKYISGGLFLLAVFAMGLVFVGSFNQRKSEQYLEQKEANRLYYRLLGEQLEIVSDFMTEQARSFAVTGDMKYFKQYWHEVKNVKQREKVIEEIEELGVPQKEEGYLERAKYFSDTLMHIEISSMKLTIEGYDISGDSCKGDKTMDECYRYVKDYPFEKDYYCESSSEKKEKSIEMLFGTDYEAYKNLIDRNIDSFQNTMNKRLDASVKEAKKKANKAFNQQIMFGAIEIMVFILMLYLIRKLYLQPILHYTHAINRDREENNYFVYPQGCFEIESFGKAFNKLSSKLLKELAYREKAETELLEIKEQLEEANQSKDEFWAHISHELRTPLNAVLGYLYLLQDTHLSGEQKRYVENMQFSSEILLEEINEILDFSKIEAGKLSYEMKQFSIGSLIEGLRAMLENEAKQRKLTLEIELEENLPKNLIGDSLRLKQVLTNLVFNGLKFTKEGSVLLKVSIEDIKEGEVPVITLKFEVKDTGIGIPPEKQEDIFQAFTQASASITRKYGGTGLGLPICKQIIEQISNGKYTIELESEYGRGSTFSFCMDFEVGQEMEEEEKNQFELDIKKKKDISILIVDDNKINLILEEELFHKFGYEVDVENNPENVISRMENKKYSMVFLDISMPEISGYDLSIQIRKQKKWDKVIVIALTANIGSKILYNVRKAGMNGYLPKPININKLREILEKYAGETIEEIDKEDIPEYGEYVKFAFLEEQLNGDRNAVKELLNIFMDDNETFEKNIDNLTKEKDWDGLEQELHRLKGVCANMKCKLLEEAVWKCYQRVKQREPFFVEKKNMIHILRETIKEMGSYGKENDNVQSADC